MPFPCLLHKNFRLYNRILRFEEHSTACILLLIFLTILRVLSLVDKLHPKKFIILFTTTIIFIGSNTTCDKRSQNS